MSFAVLPERSSILLATALLAGLDPCGRRSGAEESAAVQARRVFDKTRDALVTGTGGATLRLTASDRPGMSLPEREQKVRSDATVIDKSGLVVLSLSAIDPSRLIDGREANTPGGPMKMEATATVNDLEIILADGTEVPATMVFKDTDSDLAFVRPKPDAAEAQGVTFAPVDLAAGGRPAVADPTVSVTRLDDVFNNEPALTMGQVSAVIERPRACFLATNMVRSCPTYSLDGTLLGIAAVRITKAQGQALVIVPAAEVGKLVAQVPAAGDKPDEQK
ncbi:MAG: serine protease [Planctomycetia bacterium]